MAIGAIVYPSLGLNFHRVPVCPTLCTVGGHQELDQPMLGVPYGEAYDAAVSYYGRQRTRDGRGLTIASQRRCVKRDGWDRETGRGPACLWWRCSLGMPHMTGGLDWGTVRRRVLLGLRRCRTCWGAGAQRSESDLAGQAWAGGCWLGATRHDKRGATLKVRNGQLNALWSLPVHTCCL